MGISLARNPNQRQSEIPQDRGRIGRRIQDRVRGTECGGRFTSDHQRTNSSSAVEGDQFRDYRSTLSTTRNAGHFLQEIANAGRCGRGREPQIVCHAGHLRGLSAEVDSAALEVVSSAGRKGRAGRTMAEIRSAGTGSKAKLRNIMSALYSHAIRWEWATRNPITHVRQSAKRRTTPIILNIVQI